MGDGTLFAYHLLTNYMMEFAHWNRYDSFEESRLTRPALLLSLSRSDGKARRKRQSMIPETFLSGITGTAAFQTQAPGIFLIAVFRFSGKTQNAGMPFVFMAFPTPPAAGAPVRVGSGPPKFRFTILRHLLGEHPKGREKHGGK